MRIPARPVVRRGFASDGSERGRNVVAVDPGRTALYRLYDKSGKLLYVGITSNPAARFAKHKADKPWWPRVARKDVEWYDKRANALAAEELAIKVTDPQYNHDHSRYRPAAKVTVELTAADLAGLEMLKRVTCSRVPGGDRYTYGDLLLILLDRELAARGLYGHGRCLHAWVTWPDGVSVQPDDGVCPCGTPILPDGRWPRPEVA